MAVVIVGDTDPAQAVDRAATAFADLKRSEAPREAIPPERGPTRRREGRENYNVTHGHLCIGFLTPGFDELEANCALDVLLFMLGRGYSSRLKTAIRDRQGLAQAIGANYVSQRDPSLFEIWAVSEPGRLGALRAAMMRQLADLAKRPPSADEVKRAKRLLEGVFLRNNESFSQQARTLATYAINGDPLLIADYLPTVRSLTHEDIAGAAGRYLDVDRCTILVVEPVPNTPGGRETGGEPI
jgi:predicted Zn-dependent peptidase